MLHLFPEIVKGKDEKSFESIFSECLSVELKMKTGNMYREGEWPNCHCEQSQ
jgi:hypothetical protein